MGLRIIDISNPSNPSEIGFFSTNNTYDLAISDSFAYLANDSDGLRIIDISDPTTPTEVGIIITDGLVKSVVVNNNYAYIADGWFGLTIVDVSDPTNPIKKGYYNTHHANGVFATANNAFVADYSEGVYIIQNDLISEIKEKNTTVIQQFVIEQNYPNPFNPSTTIKYTLLSKYEKLKIHATLFASL